MFLRSLLLSGLLALPIVTLAKPIVSVNGEVITSEQLMAADPSLLNDPAERPKALQVLISRVLLAQEGEKAGLDHQAAYETALDLYRIQLLSTKTADQYWHDHPVTEKEILSAYADLEKQYPVTEYRFRDILVKNLPQAEDCLRKLKEGGSFSMLANRYSDGANASIGGESGWVPEDRVPTVFVPVLKDSRDGVVTGPIAVPSGWAIVQMLQKRTVFAPALATVRERIVQDIKNRQIEAYVQKLRKRSSIKLLSLKDAGGNSK